jgi:3-hydroxyacyl-[acyl-carrier-protein] dehydratase
MRYLLLDRVTRWVPGREAEGVKNVSLSEDFFEDHFPLKPVMPGTLIIEGMAQLAGILLEEAMKAEGARVKALMSQVERAKFRRPVYPGDRLVYLAKILQVGPLGGRASAVAACDGAPAADCSLLFSFHQFDDPRQESARSAILAAWLADARVG